MKLYYNDIKKDALDVKYKKRTEVFNWGLDNSYPTLVKGLVDNSVTASECVEKVSKAIYGRGFGEVGNNYANFDTTWNELLRMTSRAYALQNNIFFHIQYNLNLNISSIKIVPAKNVRYGKADDRGYSGKFVVYNNWDRCVNSRILKQDFVYIDKYNPSKNVIKSQVKAAGGIENYNGQILHIKKNAEDLYSLPYIFPVMPETLLEKNSQIFRKRGAENGFLNSKAMVLPPFASPEERSDFQKKLRQMRGAENSNNLMTFETPSMTEDVTKAFDVKDISSDYNDNLFSYSDEQAEKNICKAFEVPLILISQNDSSIFGNSGELLKVAKQQLWESRWEERLQLENKFNELASHLEEELTEPFKIQENV